MVNEKIIDLAKEVLHKDIDALNKLIDNLIP